MFPIKLANWLESYAEAMELNVWTGITIASLKQNTPAPGKPQTWSIEIKREDDSTRILKPRHVVFAHGWGGGVPKIPTYPGMVRQPLLNSPISSSCLCFVRRTNSGLLHIG